MRFEAFQNDVGRDLEDDIGDEKYRQSSVILRPFQTQILREAKHSRIRNVGPIEEGQ